MKIFLRKLKKKLKEYRRENKVPGVIYGPDFESKPIYADAKELSKFIQEHESGQTEIEFDGKNLNIILQDIQYHPITDMVIHFDLYVPSADKPVTTDVPLVFIGEAPALKKGGILNINLKEIEVEALPKDLPEKIEVDLSKLEEVHQSIYLKDLNVPAKVKILLPLDLPVVTIIEEETVKTTPSEIEETSENIPQT